METARKYKGQNRLPHDVLPLAAQEVLRQAAAIARALPVESVPRKSVVEKAIQSVRRRHPELFR